MKKILIGMLLPFLTITSIYAYTANKEFNKKELNTITLELYNEDEKELKIVEDKLFNIQKKLISIFDKKFHELNDNEIEKLITKINKVSDSNINEFDTTVKGAFSLLGNISIDKEAEMLERMSLSKDINIDFELDSKFQSGLSMSAFMNTSSQTIFKISDTSSYIELYTDIDMVSLKEKVGEYNTLYRINKFKIKKDLNYTDFYKELFGIDKETFNQLDTAYNQYLDVVPLNKVMGEYNGYVERFFAEDYTIDVEKVKKDLDKLLKKRELVVAIEQDVNKMLSEVAIFKIYKKVEDNYFFTINPAFIIELEVLSNKYEEIDISERYLKKLKDIENMKMGLIYAEAKKLNALKLEKDGSLVYFTKEKVDDNNALQVAYIQFTENKIIRAIIGKIGKRNISALIYNKSVINFIVKEGKTISYKCDKKYNVESKAFGNLDVNTLKYTFNAEFYKDYRCDDNGKPKTEKIVIKGNGTSYKDMIVRGAVKNTKTNKTTNIGYFKASIDENYDIKSDMKFKYVINKCDFTFSNKFNTYNSLYKGVGEFQLKIIKCKGISLDASSKYNYNTELYIDKATIDKINEIKNGRIYSTQELQ